MLPQWRKDYSKTIFRHLTLLDAISSLLLREIKECLTFKLNALLRQNTQIFFFPLIIWLWQGSEQTTPKMNCKAGEKLGSAPLNLSLPIPPVCIFFLLLRCNTPQENTYIACYLREAVVMLCDLLLFANQVEDLQRMEILRCWETGDSHAWDDTVYRKQSTVLLALGKKGKKKSYFIWNSTLYNIFNVLFIFATKYPPRPEHILLNSPTHKTELWAGQGRILILPT